jgi:glycerol-3-phosphate dehydrogenase subunit C
MTTVYDPHDPKYLDEKDVREELTRVYDLCHGCRLCFKFCTSFPTLFSYVDAHDDQDTHKLTKAQQDQVVDECFQCKLCDINCPYTPAKGHEWQLDFPRLMLRADSMRHATGQIDKRKQLTTSVMGHTDLVGKIATTVAPLANAATAKPGSLIRKVIEKTAGISSERVLPPFAKQRFTTWFNKRTHTKSSKRQGKVAIFPTCLVEYQAPEIGHDLVKVYERNSIDCSLVDGASCCGAPFLHSGDLDAFTKVATKNVRALARAVRGGNDIVVPQPTCSYILKKDYVEYVGGADAKLVSEHTFDSSEYLMKVHKGEDTSLDITFNGNVPEDVTYHTPCHLRAQNMGLKSRDLMKLTGTKIKLVQQCSGIDGMWGLRAENAGLSIPIGKKLGDAIHQAGGDVVAGDCHLANGVIVEQTGRTAFHPLQVMARAYGISEEPKK